MANNPQSTNKACFQDLGMRTCGFTPPIDVCQVVEEKEQGASNGRQGPKSASFSLNPQICLGFTNPIWVERGTEGLHPKTASITGRPAIGASDNQVGQGLGYLDP